jgi:hypothetical protein
VLGPAAISAGTKASTAAGINSRVVVKRMVLVP